MGFKLSSLLNINKPLSPRGDSLLSEGKKSPAPSKPSDTYSKNSPTTFVSLLGENPSTMIGLKRFQSKT
ncbi:MAG: hypothetical protein COX62_07205 [Deltaproteobacteria bacterium CG_4_10_14_0_2_um_filter_43_8]|nr:MAG: hypothetical protein COV43_04950 [Deltaproteobacteria bacterium CG11_big_fil_rev_8_21_14_0_20_42_23]PJA19162.1 MAG: hypothetical protein COX62_07205 [Deltaproteobacteria bacterium CG_4_10_14_0_2_um_filter_43_8]PJC65123.1 MAG: hypothetical protein CO021_01340 [Deltaproteobacteria bacterium CG_4_9_14_0_2_um_filter_42_21]